jgi:hypothetical protein
LSDPELGGVGLLEQRLLARTPSHGHGGLELIGVLDPGSLGVPSALAVYGWLKKRGAESEYLDLLEQLVEVLYEKVGSGVGSC